MTLPFKARVSLLMPQAPSPADSPLARPLRYDNIDLLRAIAILSVVLFHYNSRFSAAYYRADVVQWDFSLGSYGVDLFFAVSGYCIFLTLERSASLLNFWCKRLARLQPAYVAAVMLTMCVAAFFGLPGREVSWATALGNLVWLEVIPGVPMVDGAYWSLIVELKFYFWFGVLFYINKGRSLSVIWTGFCALGAGLDLLGGRAAQVGFHLLISSYSPAFLAGVLAYETRRLPKIAVVLIGTACLAMLCISPRFAEAQWVGPLIGVVGFIFLQLTSLRLPRAITYIGLISYPLYLIHQNVGLIVIRETAEFVNSFMVRQVVALTIVISLAIVIHKTVESRWQRTLSTGLERWLTVLRPKPKDIEFRSPKLEQKAPSSVAGKPKSEAPLLR